MEIDWIFSLSVVVVGLVVVFVVLLILVMICSLMGKIFSVKSKKTDKTPKVKEEKKPKKAKAPKAAPQMKVEEGISDDIVAAISAAVACMMGGAKNYAVTGIKRSRRTRPVWNIAGIQENTRSF